MRSLLTRLFSRTLRLSPVEEWVIGIDGGMVAAGWVRITEPRSGLDQRLMHAWPTGFILWAPPAGEERISYVIAADLLQAWVDIDTIGWLSPHASSMPAVETLHCLQHNHVIPGGAS